MNFCEYIDKNNGDLQKILQKSPEAKEWFNSSTFELDSIKNLSKKEQNEPVADIEEPAMVKADDTIISNIEQIMNIAVEEKLGDSVFQQVQARFSAARIQPKSN